MKITVSNESRVLNEKFDSMILSRLCGEHGGIDSVYDGNPDDGRHLDLAHISDQMLENYETYHGEGDLNGYEKPVVVFFKDGAGIVLEGMKIDGSGWQMRTSERKGEGKLYRKSLNESAGARKRKRRWILPKK